MPQQLTQEQIDLRNLFLETGKPQSELVTYKGRQLEVRQPTLELKGEIYRSARMDVEADEEPVKKGGKLKAKVSFDMVRLELLAVIACTFFPDTDLKVFNDVDFAPLAKQYAGGAAAQLGDAAMRLMNVKTIVEAAEKKSEATQS